MSTKADWLKLAKTSGKTASKACLKTLGWILAAIFCTQKAAARAYDSGANNAVSRLSEGMAEKVNDDSNND